MKHIITTLACMAAFTFSSSPALASPGGSCHFHGSKAATEATVLACAVQRKDALAAGGKIDPTWKNVKQSKVEQVDGKKGKEWKVTFANAATKDKEKETLYLFFTVPGNFIAANFTGK